MGISWVIQRYNSLTRKDFANCIDTPLLGNDFKNDCLRIVSFVIQVIKAYIRLTRVKKAEKMIIANFRPRQSLTSGPPIMPVNCPAVKQAVQAETCKASSSSSPVKGEVIVPNWVMKPGFAMTLPGTAKGQLRVITRTHGVTDPPVTAYPSKVAPRATMQANMIDLQNCLVVLSRDQLRYSGAYVVGRETSSS